MRLLEYIWFVLAVFPLKCGFIIVEIVIIMVYLFPIENGITAAGFPLCDVEDFDDIGLTKFGKKRVLCAFTEVKALK